MSFLAPWFFAGAAAIALPILFHLVRQAIRKKRMFSTLMFLKPTPPKVKRRNRLEHLLLLLLRCALLLLLAAAFTRPFFKQPGDTVANDASNEIVAVLVDTSASMRRGSAWDEAETISNELFSELEDLQSVALLAFDRQTRTMLSFEEWARLEPNQRGTIWKERLGVLEPTFAGTSLGNAMITAAELLEDARSRNESAPEPPPGRLIVITDLQTGANLDGLAGFNWPNRVTVEVRSPDYRSESNAGIHPVASDPNAVLTATQTNTSRVFVSNADDSTKELFKIAWTDAAGRSLHEPEQVYLPPGQSRVARMPALTNAVASRIMLSSDDEDFDNVIHVVPDTPQEIHIASISDSPANEATGLPFFLRKVFQSTTRQTLLFTNYAEPTIVPADAKIDLLITTDQPGAAGLVQQQLQDGNSVLVVLDENSRGALLSSLLELPSVNVREGQTRNYALLGKIDFTHPLYAPFLDSRFSDFTGIQFWKYRRLNRDELPDARVIAEFDNGDPALIEIPRENASLFVLTSSWKQSDSRLALSSKFVPLLYSFLELNRPPRIEGQSLIVGDAISAAGVSGEVSVITPGGATLPDVTPATTFDTPGIYRLTETGKPERLIAVNISPAESRTSPLPDEDLIRLGVPVRGINEQADAIQVAREIQRKDAETEAQQKNWRWLLATAVGIFLLESWLSGRAGIKATEEATA